MKIFMYFKCSRRSLFSEQRVAKAFTLPGGSCTCMHRMRLSVGNLWCLEMAGIS